MTNSSRCLGNMEVRKLSNYISPYAEQIQEQLNSLYPGVYERISAISALPLSVGLSILVTLLELACQGQHTGMIVLARQRIAKIPSEWLLQQLPKAISESLSLEDEWEYRRLLELLRDVAPQLLTGYIEQGLESEDADIREAAEDFLPKNC